MDSRTDKGIQGSYKNQVAISDTTKCLTLYGSKWKKGWKEAMMNKLVKLELWICCDLHLYLFLAGWLKAVQVLETQQPPEPQGPKQSLPSLPLVGCQRGT